MTPACRSCWLAARAGLPRSAVCCIARPAALHDSTHRAARRIAFVYRTARSALQDPPQNVALPHRTVRCNMLARRSVRNPNAPQAFSKAYNVLTLSLMLHLQYQARDIVFCVTNQQHPTSPEAPKHLAKYSGDFERFSHLASCYEQGGAFRGHDDEC